MNQEHQPFNAKKAEIFAYRTSQQIAAAMNVRLSHVGDQLGLYKAISKTGPVTSTELAASTGLHERWLREWLRHQACNEQLEYDAATDRFAISPEACAVLCDEESPLYFGAGFSAFEATGTSAAKLPEVFKTGLGLSYDDHGSACACGIERLNNFVPRFVLVPTILPEIDGLIDALNDGISVSDVGCGAAIALLHMAKTFPKSNFIGYEVSSHALARANANADDWNLSNVAIHDARKTPMPTDNSLDFVCTFDVIHDVPFPNDLISNIRSALKPDGIWLCSDIRSFSQFKDNLSDNPGASLMYGFSLLVCMSSAMSVEGGAGLGTLGFNAEVARQMTKDAGFGSFRELEYQNAVNSYYEIRP